MGIDIPTREELIANKMALQNNSSFLQENLANYLNVTTVRYLSCDGLKSVLNYLDTEKVEINGVVHGIMEIIPDFENEWRLTIPLTYKESHQINSSGLNRELDSCR